MQRTGAIKVVSIKKPRMLNSGPFAYTTSCGRLSYRFVVVGCCMIG